MLYKAREAIGATFRRVGGWASQGHTVYSFPGDVVPPAPVSHWAPTDHATPTAGQRVFLNSKGNPWCRSSLSLVVQRIRRKLGIPLRSLYGLRHRLATEAVRAGVNL